MKRERTGVNSDVTVSGCCLVREPKEGNGEVGAATGSRVEVVSAMFEVVN